MYDSVSMRSIQGAISFFQTGKIASSRKKIAVRTMVAHGARILWVSSLVVMKFWDVRNCEMCNLQFYLN